MMCANNAVKFSRHADRRDLVEAARQRLVEVVASVQAGTMTNAYGDNFARIVLTGGGAGTALLSALGKNSSHNGKTIDWSRVLVFFGDERFVPIDSDDRNAKVAHSELLDRVGVPAEHIYEFSPSTGQNTADEVAQDYATVIANHALLGFDIHLLGMGGEGHINSLFPQTKEVREKYARVVPVYNCPKPPATRVSLTMPAINSAQRVWLLVDGTEKAEAIAAIQSGLAVEQWPAAGVCGREETIVFVDQTASSQLKPE